MRAASLHNLFPTQWLLFCTVCITWGCSGKTRCRGVFVRLCSEILFYNSSILVFPNLLLVQRKRWIAFFAPQGHCGGSHFATLLRICPISKSTHPGCPTQSSLTERYSCIFLGVTIVASLPLWREDNTAAGGNMG